MFSKGITRPSHQPKYKMKLKINGEFQKINIPQGLGGKKSLMNGPMTVNVKKVKANLFSLRHQPIPIKDFLNFKVISVNSFFYLLIIISFNFDYVKKNYCFF